MKHKFNAIVDGTQVKNSKPHPEIFLRAAAKLDTPPSHCMVLEDAAAGVTAAKAAKMRCIGVGEKHLLSKADIVVSDFDDSRLREWIDKALCS